MELMILCWAVAATVMFWFAVLTSPLPVASFAGSGGPLHPHRPPPPRNLLPPTPSVSLNSRPRALLGGQPGHWLPPSSRQIGPLVSRPARPPPRPPRPHRQPRTSRHTGRTLQNCDVTGPPDAAPLNALPRVRGSPEDSDDYVSIRRGCSLCVLGSTSGARMRGSRFFPGFSRRT